MLGRKRPTPNRVETLALHEEALSELYAAYAEALPDRAEFWGRLSAEETLHAGWLRQFQSEVGKGLTRYKSPPWPTDTSLERVKGLLAQARKSKVTLLVALSTALNLEKALIESRAFESFESDDPELSSILTHLANDTERHQAAISEAYRAAIG